MSDVRKIVYKNKLCEKCEKAYTPTSATQRWCGSCLEKRCEYCGKEYSVGKRSRYEISRYCSAECRRKALGQLQRGENSPLFKSGNSCIKVTVKCTACGKEIQRTKRHAEKWECHFCSSTCRGAYQTGKKTGESNPKYARVRMVCEWCGNVFETWPSTEQKVRFCSMKCRNDWQSDMMKGKNHHNWKGGTAEKRSCDMVSREYKAWRKAVFDRDKYVCQICGDARGGNLNAHHIKPYKDYPDLRYEVSNGITLCEQCHIRIHQQV